MVGVNHGEVPDGAVIQEIQLRAFKTFVSFTLNGPLGETIGNCEVEARISTYAQVAEVEKLLLEKFKEIGAIRVAVISWQILEG